MTRFLVCWLALLLLSPALAEDLTLCAGSYTAGTDFVSGYWYIQPAEGEIVMITYRQPEQKEQTLILTGLSRPFAGERVTTAINLDLLTGSVLTVYGGSVILQPGQEALVWVSKSGSKYHRIADCSKMKDPVAMTEAEAMESGKSACSNCCK